jgi:hypothetical protein
MGNRTFARSLCLGIALSVIASTALSAEESGRQPSKLSIESSLWMLANMFPDPADFYQLGVGFWLDEKNELYVNGTTWKYATPLGIPYGPDYGSAAERYPGYIRAFGLGLGYQRFLWKGLFVSASATPFLLCFRGTADEDLGSGFQLYLQGRLGYQIDFFGGLLFLRPSVSFNAWPVNSGLPSSFRAREEAWPSYFLCEPHFDFGFKL